MSERHYSGSGNNSKKKDITIYLQMSCFVFPHKIKIGECLNFSCSCFTVDENLATWGAGHSWEVTSGQFGVF